MRYDIDRFEVAPGSELRLTLSNPDDLLHNLVLLRPVQDGGLAVAQKAWTMPDALEKQYLPDDDAILAATRLVQPHEEQTLKIQVPNTPGDYPYICTFPGHWMTMRGIMRVTSEERGLRGVTYKFYDGLVKSMPDFSKLKPDRTGEVEGGRLIDMLPFRGMGDFSLVFEGDLVVPQTGKYLFEQQSDGGSRVWINGKLLIDRNRMHSGDKAAVVTAGSLNLIQGVHRLRYEYYDFDKEEQVVLAWSGPGLPKTYLSRQRVIDVSQPIPLKVEDRARVDRVVLPEAPPKSLAVGLPGGVNFALHTDTGDLLYAWFGPYLDVAPDRIHRGGRICLPLGERREVGLRMTTEFSGKARFLGYSRAGDGSPVFRYQIGKQRVDQRVTRSPGGAESLRITLRFPDGPPSVLTLSSKGDLRFSGGAARIAEVGGSAFVSGLKGREFSFECVPAKAEMEN